MSLRQKIGDFRSSGLDVEKIVVVVAVKSSKEISQTALKWALTNVAKPGDCVRLLLVIPTHSSSKKLWGFPKIGSDCSAGNWKSMSGTVLDQKDHITDLCNQMMSQLQDIYDPEKVRVKMKIVYESKDGAETRIIGTFGYLAPEYALTGQVSEKADVYSFGGAGRACHRKKSCGYKSSQRRAMPHRMGTSSARRECLFETCGSTFEWLLFRN